MSDQPTPLGLARHTTPAPASRSLPSPIGDKGPRQCVRVRRNGTRCGRYASIGGFVCTSHGGKAPQIVQAARERMAFLVDPCLEVLWQVLNDPLTEDGVRVNAARVILDRAGIGPTSSVEAKVTNVSQWDPKLTAMTDTELAAYMSMLQSRLLKGKLDRGPLLALLLDRKKDLAEVVETLDAQQTLGVPDRTFFDKLISLRAQLETSIADIEEDLGDE